MNNMHSNSKTMIMCLERKEKADKKISILLNDYAKYNLLLDAINRLKLFSSEASTSCADREKNNSLKNDNDTATEDMSLLSNIKFKFKCLTPIDVCNKLHHLRGLKRAKEIENTLPRVPVKKSVMRELCKKTKE